MVFRGNWGDGADNYEVESVNVIEIATGMSHACFVASLQATSPTGHICGTRHAAPVSSL